MNKGGQIVECSVVFIYLFKNRVRGSYSVAQAGRLECSGVIIIHCSLELLGSNHSPSSARWDYRREPPHLAKGERFRLCGQRSPWWESDTSSEICTSWAREQRE